MYDFRKPLAEGETEKPRNEEGKLIDDRGWPNIEGGNFPTMIWSNYMAKAMAGKPPCTDLNMEAEFPGARLNQDLSTTTFPPCGVELDQWGFPRGNDPDKFVLVTTTTPPTTAPPTGQPDNDGLPRQDDEAEAATTVPCVAIEDWFYQANPDAPRPTDPDAPVDANGSSTTQQGSTTQSSTPP